MAGSKTDYSKWPNVFTLMNKITSEIYEEKKKKDPNYKRSDATKLAVKDPRYLDAKKFFDAHKKKK